ncbi:MAG: serine hydrolase domain-containing protein, partial [Dethiobacteria bacterium]|nr:serine hydrolase domain-containing protein [Dethiobacteria bacterium]
VLLIILLSAGAAYASPADNPDDLEAFLDGFINNQMEEQNIVGVTLSLVQDGEIIVLKGYGYANLEQRLAVNPLKTTFRPGSVSKLFTWTAVMQLVEQGKLDLDADLNSYLDFEIPGYLYGAGRTAKLEPVTLRHLFTHTPGFEDQGSGLFVLAAEEMATLEDYLKNNIPARVFPPGEVMAYSNYGAALAGYIVELVSGLPFAEYVERNIYAPLGMQNSTFLQPLPDQMAPNMAEAYKFFNGQYYQGSFEYISALPAGSMSSTAEDMAKFMIAHLQDGRFGDVRILEEVTAREMHRQQFTHHPAQDGMTLGFIEQTINGRRLINHGGNTFLFATGFWLLLEENVGLFISYNGGTGIEREALIKAFMDRYYPSQDALAELVPSPDSLVRTAALTGEYQPNRGNFTTVEKLFGILSSARVNVSPEGYLITSLVGSPQQFAEVEPGVYQSRYPAKNEMIKTIVFVPNHEGTMMLCAEGPALTMTKAPWYGSSTLVGLLVGSSLLLLLTAALGWAYAAIGRLVRREKSGASKASLFARLCAVFCGLVILFLVTGLMGIISDIDPAFGVPRVFFHDAGAMDGLLILPYLFALATAGM